MRNQDQSRGGVEERRGKRGEEEVGKGTMTDGHWRRGEEEGIRVGVGGHWHRFKAPTKNGVVIFNLKGKSGGVRRDVMWI